MDETDMIVEEAKIIDFINTVPTDESYSYSDMSDILIENAENYVELTDYITEASFKERLDSIRGTVSSKAAAAKKAIASNKVFKAIYDFIKSAIAKAKKVFSDIASSVATRLAKKGINSDPSKLKSEVKPEDKNKEINFYKCNINPAIFTKIDELISEAKSSISNFSVFKEKVNSLKKKASDLRATASKYISKEKVNTTVGKALEYMTTFKNYISKLFNRYYEKIMDLYKNLTGQVRKTEKEFSIHATNMSSYNDMRESANEFYSFNESENTGILHKISVFYYTNASVIWNILICISIVLFKAEFYLASFIVSIATMAITAVSDTDKYHKYDKYYNKTEELKKGNSTSAG